MRGFSLLATLLLLVGAGFSSHAQTFAWREPGISTCYKIDFKTRHIFESSTDAQWKDLGEISLHNIQEADLYTNDDAINPVKIQGRSGTFLILECSGQIYHVDVSHKILRREDLTFYRGANCQAVQFSRKGDIFSFGGYGFWQSTNIMTQFNLVAKEWTHLVAQGDIPRMLHKSISCYLPAIDRFVVLGDKRINQTESADILEQKEFLYSYQFDDKRFVKLGEVYEPSLKKLMHDQTLSNRLLSLGQFLLIIPNVPVEGYNHDVVYLIDVLDNYKAYLWTNPNRYQIRKFNHDRGVMFSAFTNAKSLYLPQVQETFPLGAYKLIEVPIQTLLAESKSLGPVMQKPWLATFQDVALIMVVLSGILFAMWFLISIKKRAKKKQLHQLVSPIEKQFLDFLQLNFQQGYVSGHQIIAFFGKHKSSPESQRQFRAKLIDGLNKSLGLVFPGVQVLDIQADEKDQRMLTYRLTDAMYQELNKL